MHRKKLRLIHGKTDGRCWYCGKVMHPLSDWQIEHQVPVSQCGSDNIENLVAACKQCNALKGRRTVEEYRHSLHVKLENVITEAYEMAQEIGSRIGRDDESVAPEDFVLPAWLCEIQWLLHDAANKTVNASFEFYGERVAGGRAPIRGAVIEAEAEA